MKKLKLKSEIDKIFDDQLNRVKEQYINSLRLALQVIGKSKRVYLVSSIMFMEKSDDILMFADVSLNLNPNSKNLLQLHWKAQDFQVKF